MHERARRAKPLGVTLPNPYIGMTSGELTTARTLTIAAIAGVKQAGQSYGISGRSKTAATLADLQMDLFWIAEAQRILAGTLVDRTFADFSSVP